MKRPEKLVYKGKRGAAGEPLRYYAGIPARDLGPADIKRLSDEEIKEITGGDKPLYAEPAAKKEPAKRPAPKKASSTKTAPKPEPKPEPTEPADPGQPAPPAGDGGA